ncbi:MAG TPA: phenylalanine--tRNA ligase subunit beta [Candidatus Saccharimonadales bacterium]|nr:phenylalanine--tRNA ligase subunit beta [Candidatus Saccharimonadales bacterium]
MKISLNTIRYLDKLYNSAGDPAPDGANALMERIGIQLGAIEEVIPFGERFAGARIVRVVSSDDHPGADRLHVCKIDDGGKQEGAKRDEQGLVQVVCGAPNVRGGMLAVWLPPGVTVPSTWGSNEPLVLQSRDIRGQVSHGMLASPKELTIGDSHEGILEVDTDAAPGTAFVSAYNLEDEIIFDIENKMFTHRPDCFGLLGVARELAGIQHQPFKSPSWYLRPDFPDMEAETLPLTVRNELPELVPRFCAIVMRDVSVKPSPVWLQIFLAKVGLRPINNIVDYTNFFMLETGQPLHAYDYDKLRAQDADSHGATLVVRHSKPEETLKLLNGKTITPNSESIMIATDSRLIGVGGVMGGADTEVDDTTKNIVLECASFDMYSIRRTSMAHGLFTDSVTRFSKGQSPLQNKAVIAKIVDEIRRYAGGKVASELIDDNHLGEEATKRGNIHPSVSVTHQFIAARLGIDMPAGDMAALLRNVEFDVQEDGDNLTVTAPFWRTDIEIPEDIVEEVGRLYGYDKLPLGLPKHDLTPPPHDGVLDLKTKLAEALRRMGANELLTYSFVHGRLLQQVGQDPDQAFRLGNALSPDLQYYRLSLTPGLLDKVHPNIKAGHEQFALFEINKVHSKTEIDDEGLPKEFMRVGLVFAANDKSAQRYEGASYYIARSYLDALLAGFSLTGKMTFVPLHEASFEGHELAAQMVKPFEPNRSAVLMLDKKPVGVVGEYRMAVRAALKLPARCAGFEIFAGIFDIVDTTGYIALPRFPKVEQDICLRLPADTPYATVFDFVEAKVAEHQLKQVRANLSPVDIYRREGEQQKQITLRLSIASYERTLTDTEINTLLDTVARSAATELHAERV